MSTLVVLGFDGHTTAELVMQQLHTLEESGDITLEDAVIATRPPLGETRSINYGQGSPGQPSVVPSEPHGDEIVIKQMHSKTGKFTRRGAGVGLVAGLLLGGPIGGALAGATIGAIGSKLKDYGIDDSFIKEASQALKPDSSAIFLLGTAEHGEKLLAELQSYQPKLLTTSLDPAEEQRLRQSLAG